MNQVLPLNESEVIFAIFYDIHFTRELDLSLQPREGINFRSVADWDCLRVVWDSCPTGRVAGTIELPLIVPREGYDELIFCLTIPPGAAVQFSSRAPGGDWHSLGDVVEGGASRQEIIRPMPAVGATILRIDALARETTAQVIKLIWFGARNRKLAEHVAKNKVRWSPAWTGLIAPEAEWGDLTFRRELLFSSNQLTSLREKKNFPGWREHFTRLEAAAMQAMRRQPEDELLISDYAPFNDERYVREVERGRAPFYYDALRLAFVGLINEDRTMIRHALRFLMSMLHLKSWSVSAEMRVTGSTWDQRCFCEEMMTTSTALLLDWLDGALSDRARELGYTMLWDRGLSVIERDMAKFEYVHHINQGPWFCRARILAGLLLEKEWPRLGEGYVDRAVRELREGMNRYLQPDGGMDEGPIYLLATLEMILPSLIAYARRLGVDVKSLLPRALPHVPDYLGALAQGTPGLHVTDGDCPCAHPNADTYPILAALFPGSIYEKLAATSLLSTRPSALSPHSNTGNGIFAFIHGPDHLEKPTPVPATFSLLPQTGLAASYRTDGDHFLRLVFAGSKARPSHAHLDKGGFYAEVDNEPLFLDRGTVRYDDPRMFLLSRTECHNTLAPSFDGITTVEQVLPQVSMIPDAEGDKKIFRASLDLAPVWKGSLLRCRRTLDSRNVTEWTVRDEGQLEREGWVVFYLQSRHVFEGSGGRWTSGKIAIVAPWADRADTSEHLIDCEFRTVYRLRLWSAPLTSFDLLTEFSRLTISTVNLTSPAETEGMEG